MVSSVKGFENEKNSNAVNITSIGFFDGDGNFERQEREAVLDIDKMQLKFAPFKPLKLSSGPFYLLSDTGTQYILDMVPFSDSYIYDINALIEQPLDEIQLYPQKEDNIEYKTRLYEMPALEYLHLWERFPDCEKIDLSDSVSLSKSENKIHAVGDWAEIRIVLDFLMFLEQPIIKSKRNLSGSFLAPFECTKVYMESHSGKYKNIYNRVSSAFIEELRRRKDKIEKHMNEKNVVGPFGKSFKKRPLFTDFPLINSIQSVVDLQNLYLDFKHTYDRLCEFILPNMHCIMMFDRHSIRVGFVNYISQLESIFLFLSPSGVDSKKFKKNKTKKQEKIQKIVHNEMKNCKTVNDFEIKRSELATLIVDIKNIENQLNNISLDQKLLSLVTHIFGVEKEEYKQVIKDIASLRNAYVHGEKDISIHDSKEVWAAFNVLHFIAMGALYKHFDSKLDFSGYNLSYIERC